jgi:membrane-bound serine protease (ClpP class)
VRPAPTLLRVASLAAVTAAGLALACGRTVETRPADELLVYRIPVTGVVELGLAPYVERSLREAEAAGARAAILDIETPGGRVDAAQRIVTAVTDAGIPVYSYVNHRAFSAGAMIALAGERVYMRSASVIGAATPVSGEGQKAPEKIVSAMRSEMRALAEARGLDPRVAEAMVDDEIAIEGLVEGGKLLTLTTAEAVAIGYATTVRDWDDLLVQIGLEGARTEVVRVNWAERFVRFVTNPLVAPLLLTLGFLGLLVEIKTPSFGLAGAAGLTALALFFGSHYLVGLAGWEELILLGVGLAFLAVEIFVVPGFGVFGFAGIAAILGSVYLSLIGHLPTRADYAQAAQVLSASLVLMVVGAWALLRTLPRSRRVLASGIMLNDTFNREGGYVAAAARLELVGARGTALTDLRPAGAAEIDGERLDVVAESNWISAGTPIRIIRSEGYRHVVRADI